MGTSKAALEWHGSTMLRRVSGIVGRVVDGPVVVVRAPGQALPAVTPGVEVVQDAREALGPVAGLAAGLSALAGVAEVAFVSATDTPFLHPAYVGAVLAALDDDHDVVLPHVAGHQQPLAAAYRVELAPLARELVAADRLRPAFLFERSRVRTLGEAELLADAAVAALDPRLESVRNLNDVAAYEAARAEPAPLVIVQGHGRVRAATLRQAAAAVGARLGDRDGEQPLVAGDVVSFG
jgi:molybdopterin-guanine dinucleotide biosynthesis protein A